MNNTNTTNSSSFKHFAEWLTTIPDDLHTNSFSSTESSSTSSNSSTSTPSNIADAIRRLNGLSMSHLKFLYRLGSGDIGNVYLAELKDSCTGFLAAKVMDKKELEERNKSGRARTEMEILQMMEHPFLPRFYGVAESDRWLCLLTEFCAGGDLHVLRQRQPGRRFAEPAVRFYAAEVVLALEYIHMMGVVYRDLKPENVLVRSDGHIMLTDFDLSLKCNATAPTSAADGHLLPAPFSSSSSGASSDNLANKCILPMSCINVPAISCLHPSPKRSLDDKDNRKHKIKNNKNKSGRRGPEFEFVAEPLDVRSMSFVGTHEYLAPEIVSGEGHGSSVDWWTLGIFIFELLYGVTPFKGSENEMTLANIVARALELPKEPQVSSAAKDLISKLLVKEPAGRLGSSRGAAAIRRHGFFNGVNWALVRCAVPPYIPPPFSFKSQDQSSPLFEFY